VSMRKCWACHKFVDMPDLVEVNCPHCGSKCMYVPKNMRPGRV